METQTTLGLCQLYRHINSIAWEKQHTQRIIPEIIRRHKSQPECIQSYIYWRIDAIKLIKTTRWRLSRSNRLKQTNKQHQYLPKHDKINNSPVSQQIKLMLIPGQASKAGNELADQEVKSTNKSPHNQNVNPTDIKRHFKAEFITRQNENKYTAAYGTNPSPH